MRYLPIGAIVGVILVAELVFIFGRRGGAGIEPRRSAAPTPAMEQVSNTQALGQHASTPSISTCSRSAGLVLLVAMIGAIVLTHRERVGVRRQRIADPARRATLGSASRSRTCRAGSGM